MKPLKDLLKHSGVYAIGQILTRIASVLLLPLYTNCLSPAEYGAVGIMDLLASVLSVMIGGGMSAAVTRFHFEGSTKKHYDRVWWTGITYIGTVSFLLISTMWLGRTFLTELTLGKAIEEKSITLAEGCWYYTLTFANCWAFCIGYVGDTYLRVRKRSGLFVVISFGRLLINIALNIYFLVYLNWGIEGLLLGNLISSVLQTLAMLGFFVWERGRPIFDIPILKELIRFSSPMIVTALLAMLMHEADRIIMQETATMDEVGVYSLAHKIGFAIETLCILPFASIWNVSLYEVAQRDDAKQVYADVFRYFVYGFGVLLLGGALTVHPVLPLLINVDYLESIDQVAVVLLGFFFFGVHFMFEVPALLHKRTMLMVPAAVAGVVVNIAANFWLIPLEINGSALGGFGAGWAGVLTYIVYAGVGLLCYRHLYPINYPWKRPLLALLGLCATYCAVRYYCFPLIADAMFRDGMSLQEFQIACGSYVTIQIALSVGVCATWALALVWEPLKEWSATRKATGSATAIEPEPIEEDSSPDISESIEAASTV